MQGHTADAQFGALRSHGVAARQMYGGGATERNTAVESAFGRRGAIVHDQSMQTVRTGAVYTTAVALTSHAVKARQKP
jgi:hypothetical protein